MKRGYGDARRIELMLVGLQEEVFMDRDDRSVVPVMGEKKEKKGCETKVNLFGMVKMHIDMDSNAA
jgi:hypothetical protein